MKNLQWRPILCLTALTVEQNASPRQLTPKCRLQKRQGGENEGHVIILDNH